MERLVEEFWIDLRGDRGTRVPRPPLKLPSHPPVRGWGRGLGEGGGAFRPSRPPPKRSSLRIIPGQAYQALGAAHVAVVASGTATVEAALAGTPTVIVYRVSPLTFALARRLVRVPHVGMANLLAGERVFPELLQDDFTPERLAHEVLSLIQDPKRIETVRRGLATVIRRLGGPGASARAARVAVELITSARPG